MFWAFACKIWPFYIFRKWFLSLKSLKTKNLLISTQNEKIRTLCSSQLFETILRRFLLSDFEQKWVRFSCFHPLYSLCKISILGKLHQSTKWSHTRKNKSVLEPVGYYWYYFGEWVGAHLTWTTDMLRFKQIWADHTHLPLNCAGFVSSLGVGYKCCLASNHWKKNQEEIEKIKVPRK